MRGLLCDLGLAFDKGGITNAEICSYAAGLEFVHNCIQDTFNRIFINLDNNDNVLMYADMLDIDTADNTVSQLKSMIYKRLGQQYGDYTHTGFEEAFENIGSGEYEISDGTITFSNIKAQDMKKLGKFVQGYVFLFTKAVCDGSGLNFDAWDNWGQSFYKYDSLRLNFDIIDTLRSDLIE